MDENLSFSVVDERFQDPLAAADYLESIRWPNGPVCPHCGESERAPYKLPHNTRKLWKCAACRKQFTVTVGTIFEGSHIGLHKWLLAFYLLCSSKKGMSSHQLHRMLGITYKSAWFMTHRIRYAMAQPPFARQLGGIVEADETYIGGKARYRTRRYQGVKKTGRGADKVPVLALVERGGQVRSFRMANVTGDEVKGAIYRNVARESRIMTDAFKSYAGLDKEYAAHEVVNHAMDEWARADAHTNTVENFFSILKRGIDGVYHHVSEAHLPRHLSEFDFRYNHRAGLGISDAERTVAALRGAEGKRLTYAM
jgi:transposase-like protein